MLCHVMLCYVVLRVVLQYACTYVQRQLYGSILRLHIAYLCGVLPLVQDLLPYHSLVWFFPTQLLDCMGFSIFSRNGLCSLMICWLLLVPAGVLLLVSLLLSSFFLQDKGFCSMMICWFLLVLAGVPVLVSLFLSSFFPQERGSVSSWFAGSSWFRLGFRCLSPFFSLLWFRCLSPFFSLLSFLRTGVLFHHDLLVPLGSGWFRLGFRCLSPLLLSSFFPQERGSVPSWFAGSSWFRLGFRCLSPFFSLLSFLRKGVLSSSWSCWFLLVLAGVPVICWSLLLSGWGSGACLPSSLFFLSSGKGFCSIMICWFLLVPAGVPVLVSLLLPSFFPQERGSVPSWFAGSSWFRLGFRCLSPFLSLLSFLRKGVLFHHDLLVPLGSGWGSGACLPSSLFFGSGACLTFFSLLSFPQERGSVPSWFAGSSWFRLGFRCLSPFFSFLSFLRKGVLFHHDLLVPPGSGWGSGACLPSSLFFLSSGKGFCSIMICWFLLVPAGVPVLVSLLLFSFFPQERGSVPSWFAGSSWFWGWLSPFFSPPWFRSSACLPSSLFFLSSGKGFCSIMICWFLLVPAGGVSFILSSLVPVLVSLLLSSFFPQERVLFHHDLLVPLGSGWGSGACLPSSLFFGSGACLPSLFFLSSGKGFCSIMICWFLLVPAGVPVLVSLLLSSFFPQERGPLFHHGSWWGSDFLSSVPSWFRLGFRCLSPFFSLLSFPHESACLPSSLFMISWKGVLFHHDLLIPAGVPVLVSLLLSSFFPQERGSVPSWFAGSSWFRLGFRCLSPFFSLLWFRCLSPFFSLLSFLRTGVLFHHDLLVPPGSGWGSGACLPSSLFFLSIRKGVLFHHDLLVPLAPGWGSGACLPSSLSFLSSGKGFCSIVICWFLLVPAGVRVLVSFLLSSLVPVLVSLLLSSFFPQERGFVSSWFADSSWFGLGFRCLSPFISLRGFRCLSPFFSLGSFLRKRVMFHHGFSGSSCFGLGFRCLSPFFSLLWFRCLSPFFFRLSFLRTRASVPSWISWFILLPAGVPVLVSLLLSSLVPVLVSLLLSSFFPQERDSVPSWISWFLPLRAGVPVLVSLLLSSFFLGKGVLNIMMCKTEDRSVPESSMNFELRMTLVETCVVAVWGLCWCNCFGFRVCLAGSD